MTDPKPSKLHTSNADELLIERARAIEGYANIERSLARIFGNLLGTTPQRAAIVFFRITSSHARNIILESLIEERFGSTYRNYWDGIPKTPTKGLFSILKRLDQRRNEIVHWHTVVEMNMTPTGQFDRHHLSPPNFWAWTPEVQEIGPDELREFTAQADFVTRSLNMFDMFASGLLDKNSPEAARTWREIFQQPCTYPPPDTHPLSPNYAAPKNPPQSSEA